MAPRSTIQKLSGIVLLIVFLIGTAPRTHFHELVADHKDVSNCDQLHQSAVLHAASYHCHFDDLVVVTPFVLQAEQPPAVLNFFVEPFLIKYNSFFFQSFFQHKENRGPPIG